MNHATCASDCRHLRAVKASCTSRSRCWRRRCKFRSEIKSLEIKRSVRVQPVDYTQHWGVLVIPTLTLALTLSHTHPFALCHADEKDRKIYDLKKKHQELEKFKFVLDFKIKELKKQIEPRETQITAMKDRIKVQLTRNDFGEDLRTDHCGGCCVQDMDAELERYHKVNSQLDEKIGDLRTELSGVQASTKKKQMQARSLVCKHARNVFTRLGKTNTIFQD